MIGGKWKIPILWHLFDGPKRFGELQRALAPITQKVLIQQLRDLEADALVTRTVYAEVPPRVDYTLTPIGESLSAALAPLCAWGLDNVEAVSTILREREEWPRRQGGHQNPPGQRLAT